MQTYPIYRATDWANNSYDILSWLLHYGRVGRNAGILLFDRKFSVWVQGTEYVEDPEIPNSEEPRGPVIMWVNGFKYYYAG